MGKHATQLETVHPVCDLLHQISPMVLMKLTGVSASAYSCSLQTAEASQPEGFAWPGV